MFFSRHFLPGISYPDSRPALASLLLPGPNRLYFNDMKFLCHGDSDGTGGPLPAGAPSFHGIMQNMLCWFVIKACTFSIWVLLCKSREGIPMVRMWAMALTRHWLIVVGSIACTVCFTDIMQLEHSGMAEVARVSWRNDTLCGLGALPLIAAEPVEAMIQASGTAAGSVARLGVAMCAHTRHACYCSTTGGHLAAAFMSAPDYAPCPGDEVVCAKVWWFLA